MDIISHGLWGGIAFGRKNIRSFWLSFMFGIAPDALSFGPFFILMLFGFAPRPSFHMEPPQDALIPGYVHMLYSFTHSLVIFAILFVLLSLMVQRPVFEFLAWGLHIVVDIPLHTSAFFPTPFLWPFSHTEVNGIPWSHPFIFIPNVILLLVLYSWFLWRKRKIRTSL